MDAKEKDKDTEKRALVEKNRDAKDKDKEAGKRAPGE